MTTLAIIATATLTGFNPAWLLLAIPVAALLLASRKKKDKKPSATLPPLAPGRPQYFVGPVVNGINHSTGMPGPLVMQGNGCYFDVPSAKGTGVHALQWLNPPSMVGKRELRARFKVTGGGFVPKQYDPNRPELVDKVAKLGVLLQRRGDNWSNAGQFAAYRMFWVDAIVLAPGEFELVLPIEPGNFKTATGSNGVSVQDLRAMLQDLDNISFIFGSSGGRAKGVYATQPSRIALLAEPEIR